MICSLVPGFFDRLRVSAPERRGRQPERPEGAVPAASCHLPGTHGVSQVTGSRPWQTGSGPVYALLLWCPQAGVFVPEERSDAEG